MTCERLEGPGGLLALAAWTCSIDRLHCPRDRHKAPTGNERGGCRSRPNPSTGSQTEQSACVLSWAADAEPGMVERYPRSGSKRMQCTRDVGCRGTVSHPWPPRSQGVDQTGSMKYQRSGLEMRRAIDLSDPWQWRIPQPARFCGSQSLTPATDLGLLPHRGTPWR